MKPHRLPWPCLIHTPSRPSTGRGQLPASTTSSHQPYLPSSRARGLTSTPSTPTMPSSTSPPHDPWSYLLGRPDPSAPPPPMFNYFRAPPAPPRAPFKYPPAHSPFPRPPFKPPSAYFPTPLSPYQQHLQPPSSTTGGAFNPSRPPLDPTYSTITERERAIFSTIFESILSESPPVKSASSGPRTPSALTALFESAVGPQLSNQKVSFGPSITTTSPTRASNISAAMARASAIADYPPSLRLAAAQAAGLPGIPLTESESKQEAVRQSQLIQLTTEMDSCETDVELLSFLDTRVFTMITSPESNSTDTLHIKGRKFVFPSASYADLLAHALRLLLRSFRDLPSTLYIFQRIKSLGPESYVIGCTVTIYNIILTAQWESYRSISLISNTLREMSINGIEGDRETVEVLRAICLDALGSWTGHGVDREAELTDREKEDLSNVGAVVEEIGGNIKEKERIAEMERQTQQEQERLREQGIDVEGGSAGLGLALGLEGRKKWGRRE